MRAEGVAAFAARGRGAAGDGGEPGRARGDLERPGRAARGGLWAWLAGFAVVLAVAGAGCRCWGGWPPGAAVGLLAAAGAGLVLAVAPALPGLRGLAELVATSFPGAG